MPGNDHTSTPRFAPVTPRVGFHRHGVAAVVSFFFLAMVLVSPVACQAPQATSCGDLVCPAGRMCVPELDQCVLPAQLQACHSTANGQPCSFDDSVAAECVAGACVPLSCGDGVVTSDERCDDGNTFGGDGCSPDCQGFEECGDGIVDLEAGESCDCGDGRGPLPPGCDTENGASVDSLCSAECTLRSCGDGRVSASEDCDRELVPATCQDFGFDGGELACSPLCRFDTAGCTGACGDGQLDPSEVCDGAPPEELSCLDFGFSYGRLSCSNACFAVTDACGSFGPAFVGPLVEGFGQDVWKAEDGTIYLSSDQALLFRRPGAAADAPWEVAIEGLVTRLDGDRDGRVYALAREPDRVLRIDGPGVEPVAVAIGTTEVDQASAVLDVCATQDRVLFVGSVAGFELDPVGPTPNLATPIALPYALSRPAQCLEGGGQLWLWANRLHRWTRDGWQEEETPEEAAQVFGLTDGSLVAVSDEGEQLWLRRAGTDAWTEIGSPFGSSYYLDSYRDMTGRADSIVVFFRQEYYDPSGSLAYFDGTRWTRFSVFGRGTSLAIAGQGIEDLTVATGGEQTERPLGVTESRGNWTADYPVGARAAWLGPTRRLVGRNQVGDDARATVPAGAVQFQSIWADEREAVAVAGSRVYQLEDDQWVEVARLNSPLAAVSRRFAVGADGLLVDAREDWSPVTAGPVAGLTEDLYGVSQSTDDTAFVVGDRGLALRFEGDTWTEYRLEPPVLLTDVWALSPTDAVAVGLSGRIVRFDGTEWRSMRSPTRTTLRAITGLADGRLFAVGDDGVALYFDGTAWSELERKDDAFNLRGSDVTATETELLFLWTNNDGRSAFRRSFLLWEFGSTP